jgi:hypothetical protein
MCQCVCILHRRGLDACSVSACNESRDSMLCFSVVCITLLRIVCHYSVSPKYCIRVLVGLLDKYIHILHSTGRVDQCFFYLEPGGGGGVLANTPPS